MVSPKERKAVSTPMSFSPASDVEATIAVAIASICEHSRVIRSIMGHCSRESLEQTEDSTRATFVDRTSLVSEMHPISPESMFINGFYVSKLSPLRRVAVYAVRNVFGDPLFPFDDVCVSLSPPQLHGVPLVQLKV